MTYQLLSFTLRTLSRIPFWMLYLLSDVLYGVMYHIVRYRRKVAHRNLTECFPEKSSAEIKTIEKKFYHFLSDTILESCKMATISKEEIKRRMKFTNVEEVNTVLRSGKSISLFMGHYGNWEWVSSMPLWLEKGIVAAQIYHKLSNEAMERIITHNRERMGAVGVEMRKTARYVNELALEHKVSIIGYIADQSPRIHEVRYFLPFLHHDTPVLVGTEKITKHYNHEAWFLEVNRSRRGYYEATFRLMHHAPKSLPDFELTDIYYRFLEQIIKKHPELYLWTHNRFRHARGRN